MSDPIQLSVRPVNQNSGGPVSPPRLIGGTLSGRSNLLILVHGYNNSASDALASYGQFLAQLKTKFSTLADQVVEFQWPGDEPNRIISTLSYPNQIGPAIASAAQLATFLASMPRPVPIQINIVGHSLGCRVTLELLARWTGGLPANLYIGAVVLMAAAVVIKQVDTGGALNAAAQIAVDNPVLYSKGDPVLHWAFPIGETAAGEAFFPSAVGRTGGPAGIWHFPQAMADNGQAYVHGSYWGGDSSTTAVAAALGGAPARMPPVNAITASPPPPANAITSRATPVNAVAGRPAFA